MQLRNVLNKKGNTFTQMYPDSCVGRLNGTSNTACYVPAFEINQTDSIIFSVSIVAAQLCAMLFAPEVLHRTTPSEAMILTDSRTTLLRTHNTKRATFVCQGMIRACRSVKDSAWTFGIHWAPSYVGLTCNEVADLLISREHGHTSGHCQPFR